MDRAFTASSVDVKREKDEINNISLKPANTSPAAGLLLSHVFDLGRTKQESTDIYYNHDNPTEGVLKCESFSANDNEAAGNSIDGRSVQYTLDKRSPNSREVILAKSEKADALDQSLDQSWPLAVAARTNDVRPDVSDLCLESFSTEKNLKRFATVRAGRKSLPCPHCPLRLPNKSTLKRHVRIHTGEKPHACVVCDKRFSQSFNLKSHLKTHTSEKRFACEYCGKTLRTRRNLKMHVMIHTQEKPHECLYCHKRFIHRNSLNNHIMSHTGERPYSCTVCGNGFSQKCQLKLHAVVHSGEKPHHCVLCTKSFGHLRYLKQHLKLHEQQSSTGNANHSSCAQNLSLPVTHQSATDKLEALTQRVGLDRPTEFGDLPSGGEDAENSSSEDAKRQFELYHDNVVGSYSDIEDTRMRRINKVISACDLRSKSHIDGSKLKRYTGLHNASSKPFLCPWCSMRFSNHSDVKNHTLTHSADRPLVSVICDKRFAESFSLKSHLRTHTGEIHFKCDNCGKTFSTKRNLKLHMMIHTQEKPHGCPYCHKRFIRRTVLKNHLLTHTGERPYSCTVCGKAFVLKCNLRQHAAIHTREYMQEKLKECPYCQKRFTQRSTLKVHLRTHTGERPYSCTVCEQTFKRSGHLKQHAIVHTGERPHQCTRCTKRFKDRSQLKRHSMLHSQPFAAESVSHAGFTHNESDVITDNNSSSGENFEKTETGIVTDVHQSGHNTYNMSDVEKSTRELYFDNVVGSCQQPEDINTWNNISITDTGNGCISTMSSRTSHDEKLVRNYHSTSGAVWQPNMRSTETSMEQQQQQEGTSEYSKTELFHQDAGILWNDEALFSPAPIPRTSSSSQCNAEVLAKRYVCENCPSRYSVSSQLQQHSLTHDVETAYECEECRTRFTDYGQLLWHMLAHAQEHQCRQFQLLIKPEPAE